MATFRSPEAQKADRDAIEAGAVMRLYQIVKADDPRDVAVNVVENAHAVRQILDTMQREITAGSESPRSQLRSQQVNVWSTADTLDEAAGQAHAEAEWLEAMARSARGERSRVRGPMRQDFLAERSEDDRSREDASAVVFLPAPMENAL